MSVDSPLLQICPKYAFNQLRTEYKNIDKVLKIIYYHGTVKAGQSTFSIIFYFLLLQTILEMVWYRKSRK